MGHFGLLSQWCWVYHQPHIQTIEYASREQLSKLNAAGSELGRRPTYAIFQQLRVSLLQPGSLFLLPSWFAFRSSRHIIIVRPSLSVPARVSVARVAYGIRKRANVSVV